MFLLPWVLAGTHSKRSIKTSWFWWANHEASNCLFEGRQLITIWDNDGCGAIDRISEPVLHDLWVSPKLEGPDHVLQVNCNCSWTRQEVSHHRVKLQLVDQSNFLPYNLLLAATHLSMIRPIMHGMTEIKGHKKYNSNQLFVLV